ncbi:hypothetical protein [Sphingomonas solaris]|uniref:Uncharacterized protein n=1 Tax=Alterirhizorhabdus solaris TaxID=2529389 RepID=A0A558RB65_9SPHN|nr:hypothetical protein [Sphingomonas solaris]TVV76616.1 hypothetical protein FOY91_03555 [Sphingomonas solaris]
MPDPDSSRLTLRRRTHAVNDDLAELLDSLDDFDKAAARAVRQARTALFEAWTILCVPPDDEEDH